MSKTKPPSPTFSATSSSRRVRRDARSTASETDSVSVLVEVPPPTLSDRSFQCSSGDAAPEVPKGSDARDEEACGKVWEIYAKEAQEYDRTLVQSWKDDMDNILVFSGLYSAVLTAFVIESYKNLQEDPAETSATLLKYIALQLASPADARNATLPQVSFDGPTKPALACNILWFISLILALFCAFLATLVQQWARQFMQKMGMARSPVRKARLLQFLYFGVKRFRMDAVVDMIPSLLHLSLFTFFGGLVAFLNPVNRILTGLVAAALLAVIAAYSTFTLLPLIQLYSPFRTPLSSVLWFFSQDIKWSSGRAAVEVRKYWQRLKKEVYRSISPLARSSMQSPGPVGDPEAPKPPEKTHESMDSGEGHSQADEVSDTRRRYSLIQAVLEASRANNFPMNNRDFQAEIIAWTLKSMNDDRELLPFVEALLDLLWGPEGLREGNCPMVKGMLQTTDPECDIIGKTVSLMSNMGNSWFDDTHRERCRVACPRLLHSLATALLPINRQRRFILPLTTPGTNLRRITWFSVDHISAIVNGMEHHTLDHASASSALALCLLLVCQDIEDVISQPNFGGVPQSQIQDYLQTPTLKSLATYRLPITPFTYFSSGDYFLNYKPEEPFKDQVTVNINYLRSSTYVRFIEHALAFFPYSYGSTVSYFRGYTTPRSAEACAYLLHRYVDSYPDTTQVTPQNHPPLDIAQSDQIATSVLDFIDTLWMEVMEASSFVVYISWRAKRFGLTTTLDMWQGPVARWGKLATAMTWNGTIGHSEFEIGRPPYPGPIGYGFLFDKINHDLCTEAYREVFLCLALGDGLHQRSIFAQSQPPSTTYDKYGLLLRVQESLQQHRATLPPPQLSLKYLVDFIAISAFQRQHAYDHELADRINKNVERLLEDLGPNDMPIQRKVDLAAPIVLVQVLTSLDPLKFPTESREILEYFSWLDVGYNIWAHAIEEGVVYPIAKKLLAICKHFANQPSVELLDSLTILWHGFENIASDLLALWLDLDDRYMNPIISNCRHSVLPTEQIWSALHPLIPAAEFILSPQCQVNISRLLGMRRKPVQTRYQPFEYDKYDLITEVRRIWESLLNFDGFEPYVIPLPDPNGDEMATLVQFLQCS